MKEIEVIRNVLQTDLEQAALNRARFAERHIACVNIMGSPGCGKTTLIEAILTQAGTEKRVGVIEGDYEGTTDTERLLRRDIPVVQVNAHSCHLNAAFVKVALDRLPLDRIDLLFIENIGNLICTASYDLGEALRLVILSVPEGDDKPDKYPKMFSVADLVVVSKADVLPHFDFSLEQLRTKIARLNPRARVLPVSAKLGQGMAELWAELAALKAGGGA
jgi:hydrogenase nickel incorporation protein HypB